MNEKLLQFIWQFQYFRQQGCETTEGDPLSIEKPGRLNKHQGPDFSEAIVRIGTTVWVGNIELHIRSSDWDKHRHGYDTRYANIILHVVWEDDQPVLDRLGNRVATLVLQSRVAGILLSRYRLMMEAVQVVPCNRFLPVLEPLAWTGWKERLAAERLMRKSARVLDLLAESGNHWDAVCWRVLAEAFGGKVNNVLFGLVAQSIPVNLLYKHRNQIHQLEALLLGQANLLQGRYTESYPLMLQKEYRFLRKKYMLSAVHKQPAFLRMRPAAFPTLRLAQLAMLLYQTEHLFAKLKNTDTAEAVLDVCMVRANDYWNIHYRFDEVSASQHRQLGRQMAESILINGVIPLLFAYGLHANEQSYKDKAIHWLSDLSGEQNRITGLWKARGITNQSALDSQALIELTNQYCMLKRCLDCAVGNKILKNHV